MKVLDQVITDDYAIYHGDAIEVTKSFPDNSIDYQFQSPPFQSLFTYSNSDRDMSNSSDSEFWDHYKFLIQEEFRTLKEGRLISIHCMNLPTSKFRDGYIGIRDFRGDIIRAYEKAGFIFHSEVVIYKDPAVAMQRTKAQPLLHATIKKDSCKNRMGLPEYVVTFKKPGDNVEPVSGELKYYTGECELEGFEKVHLNDGRFISMPKKDDTWNSINIWNRFADPIYFDLNETNTLNKKQAKDKRDERHLSPTNLDLIERCIQLWTNEGDTVKTSFAGIGSELYVALKHGRKAVGIELKESYFEELKKNMEDAVTVGQYDLGF